MRCGFATVCVLLAAGFAGTGCVHQRAHSVCRVWADWNTQRQPALFIEKIEHRPYRAADVGYFRWIYGLDPGHGYKNPITHTGAVSLPPKIPLVVPTLPPSDSQGQLAPPPMELDLQPLPEEFDGALPFGPIPGDSQPDAGEPDLPGVPPLPSTEPGDPTVNSYEPLRSAGSTHWLWRSAGRQLR